MRLCIFKFKIGLFVVVAAWHAHFGLEAVSFFCCRRSLILSRGFSAKVDITVTSWLHTACCCRGRLTSTLRFQDRVFFNRYFPSSCHVAPRLTSALTEPMGRLKALLRRQLRVLTSPIPDPQAHFGFCVLASSSCCFLYLAALAHLQQAHFVKAMVLLRALL